MELQRSIFDVLSMVASGVLQSDESVAARRCGLCRRLSQGLGATGTFYAGTAVITA